MLNINPICVIPMLHPMTSPPAAENSATSSTTAASSTGRSKLKVTPRPSNSRADTTTTAPAASACIMPARTFSTASHPIFIGASSRSSISRVN